MKGRLEVWPSIDLMNGKVVRLTKGRPDTAKVYSDNPMAVAKRWIEGGADGLHIIDLDATLNLGENRATISSLVGISRIPIQVGGGVRSIREAEDLFKLGVYRVLVGTMAFHSPQELKQLIHTYGDERVMVALDYMHGMVMVKGWTQPTGVGLRESLERLRASGVKLFLLTSIDKDGTLTGPDTNTLKHIVELEDIEIFASGGIRSIRDLEKLKQLGVRGVVLGKALYEGIIELKEAVAVARR